MNTDNLLTFLSVCRHRSYTVAGKELGLSQSAVWRQVRKLEADLGTTLIEQLGRELHLTDAGRTLSDEAKQLVGHIGRMEEAVRAHSAGLGGRIRVGASTTPGFYLIPEILGAFHRENPSIQILFQVTNSETVERGLTLNELDIGFVGGTVHDSALKIDPWLEDEIVCFAAPSHELAGSRSVAPKSLLEATCVIREPGSATRVLFESWLDSVAGPLQDTLEVRGPEVQKSLVRAGLGFSVMSRFGVEADVRRGDLEILPVKGMKVRRPIAIARHGEKHVTPAMTALIEACEQRKG